MEFKQWIIDNLLTIITTVFGSTSFVGYILERKKRRIQERQETTDALKSMQEAYDRFSQDLLKRYEDLSKEMMEVKKRLTEVTLELEGEKLKYKKLEKVYAELTINLKHK